MKLFVEVDGLEEVGDSVEGVVVDEDGSEQGHFGVKVVGRQAVVGLGRNVEAGRKRICRSHRGPIRACREANPAPGGSARREDERSESKQSEHTKRAVSDRGMILERAAPVGCTRPIGKRSKSSRGRYHGGTGPL
ncbi:hypothetical protein GCM10010994_35850 [Chelatococcus reniformis]|uniref:Uncharacterized protein n=1 Tax=Chelatococcus reniformis TaxID=1494448 RepID=A0A916UJ28_9HYPH|nr:hypothetical protein GCM10010994_35850 [Chelatococcus reniformis]